VSSWQRSLHVPAHDGEVNRPIVRSRPRTLAVSIDPPELSATLLDPHGGVLAGPMATTGHLSALWEMVESLGEFDRISAGYAGAVHDGVAVNGAWTGFALERELAAQSMRPARAIGMAEIAIPVDGVGVEVALSFGETLGSSLYVHGIAVPVELGAHVFKKKKTYTEYVGGDAFADLGRKKWNKRAHRVIDAALKLFSPRRLYVGGRDGRFIYGDLPSSVTIVPMSLVGALGLWE
jgi:polyphosphate glucokinase